MNIRVDCYHFLSFFPVNPFNNILLYTAVSWPIVVMESVLQGFYRNVIFVPLLPKELYSCVWPGRWDTVTRSRPWRGGEGVEDYSCLWPTLLWKGGEHGENRNCSTSRGWRDETATFTGGRWTLCEVGGMQREISSVLMPVMLWELPFTMEICSSFFCSSQSVNSILSFFVVHVIVNCYIVRLSHFKI
jgi:hypothetical protein